MKPYRYEPGPGERRRLTGMITRRGSGWGLFPGIGFLFGCPFLGVGTYLVLIGTRLVAVNPAKVHAPYWVLACAGLVFGAGGLLIWAEAWKQFSARQRRKRFARERPDEPALADYPWGREGFEVSDWAAAAKAVAGAIGLTVFLSMFNYWAFFTGAPFMVKVIVGLFDAIGVILWVLAGRQVGRALKFGRSRIIFPRFPYRLGEPVTVRWQAPMAISQVQGGKFTLRCVEEWVESTGSGRNRHTTVVHEEIWSGAWVMEQPRNFLLREIVELTYDLPPDAQPTQLSATKPVFWELQVELKLPGLDFNETYLVPIYSPKTAPLAPEPLAV